MDLEALRGFLAVVEAGSFSAAATSLRCSRSTLRRRIDELEIFVGVPLLVRTEHGVSPTAAGDMLLGRGRGLMAEMSAMLSSVRAASELPAYTLRIALPVGLPPRVVAMLLATQRIATPHLRIHARVVDDPLSLLLDDVDVVVTLGGDIPQGPWVSHDIVTFPERLVASPSYLAAHGTPTTLEELSKHPVLLWECPEKYGRILPLRAGGEVFVDPVLISADLHLLRECAAGGMGLVYGPDPLLPDGFAGGGAMVPVLESLIGRERVVRLVIPSTLSSVPRLSLAIEQFVRFVSQPGGPVRRG